MKKSHLALLVLAPVLLLVQFIFSKPGLPPIIDAHESVESVAEIVKLQTTMANLGITHTVLAAIPDDLLYYKGNEVDLSGVDENNEAIRQAVEAYPDQFSFLCSIDPNDPQRNDELASCLEKGAVGVKLYNGYSYAHEVPLDDAKLTDFYAALTEDDVPLMLPVNLSEYEAELRNVLTLNPDLTVLCPHFCLSSKNLPRLTTLMTDFPNLYIDTSFGHVDFAKEGFQTISENHDAFVSFFTTFQDRIVFGTDSVLTSYEDKTVEWLDALYGDYISLFTEEEFTCQIDSTIQLTGLALPYEIQQKLFYQNWNKLLN
jgi:predicted TIM-barrel fold metal-dependent hydrolase